MDEVVEKLNGIIGVINTPFNKNNQIDSDSLRNYIDHSIDAGVTGFLALGMAAETNKLTHEEREFIVKTVVDKVGGRVPVISSVSSDNHEERLLLTRKFIDYGCDGIMVNILFEDENSFCKQISEIDKLNPQFLMIQDWDFKGFGIPVNIIKKLFDEIESFKCLKIEVVPAGVKYTAVRDATENKLHVSGGWAGTQMIEALDRGVNAFMPTVLHYVYVKIFNLHRAGRREEAKELFYELVPILAFSHQHLDISIHFNKKLVCRQGLFSTDKVREPILPFDEYHGRVAEELIMKAQFLTQKVKKNRD
jgi:dihydrodipicolinate synthase/N-acetylneuraminate lyase